MTVVAYHCNCGCIVSKNVRHHETNQHFEVDNTVHFFLVQHPDLIYLILLAAVHSLWVRRRPQPELRIAEVSVSVDIMQAFPDDLLLCEETLVCDQEVQLTLGKTRRVVCEHSQAVVPLVIFCLEVTGGTYSFVYTGNHRIVSKMKVSGLHFPYCR